MRFQALLSMALSTYCGLVNSAVVPDLGTWTTSLVPRDINRDGIVDVYYDKNLNLTWLADFGLLPGVPWQTAELWARNFEIFGIAGWRLPIMTDLNYFNDLAGTSEFGSLYFTTLGVKTREIIYYFHE